jgi:hypothetical protein
MATFFASRRATLSIAAVGALCCLTPLIDLNRKSRYTTDDATAFQQVTSTLLQRSPSLLACFFVVLIPAADLFLDLPSHISSYLQHEGKSSKKGAVASVVFRLNEVERLLFMIGVCIQSCVWFLSNSVDAPTLGIVYSSTTNASSILVLAPILSYLQRCTTTFTPKRAFVIVTVASIGLMLVTACNFVRDNAETYRMFFYVGISLSGLSAFIFCYYIFLSAYNYSRENLHLLTSDRLAIFVGLNRKISPELIEKKYFAANDADRDLYTIYIPALHMIVIVIVILANSVVQGFTGPDLAIAYEAKNYIVIVAEIIVLVIELRIRKNEIARGLVWYY